jgi:8-oxo-dGTP pyrophosphatase MutT (NUDIX family)
VTPVPADAVPADVVDVVERRAARVLLVDAARRVLLFHGCDPADPAAGDWWFTPGGGLDPGETPAQGAARELAEETGLQVLPEALGPPVHDRVAVFRYAGGSYRQSEDFFVLCVDAHDVDTSGFSELEVSAVLGHRWWTPQELRGTRERVYPSELPELLERLAE